MKSGVLAPDPVALSCLNSFRGRSHLHVNVKHKVPYFSACDVLGGKQLNNKLSVCLQAFLLDGKDYALHMEKGSLGFFWCVFISVFEVPGDEVRCRCISRTTPPVATEG